MSPEGETDAVNSRSRTNFPLGDSWYASWKMRHREAKTKGYHGTLDEYIGMWAPKEFVGH